MTGTSLDRYKPWPLSIQRKNSDLKFRKFHVPNWTVHSGCTDPTQATARLVIVLVRRIQKSGIGDNNFVKCKGTKMVPNIPVRQNRNGSFHLISNRNFRDFGLNGKRPIFPPITAILTLYKMTLFVSFFSYHNKLTCTTCMVSIAGSELGIGTFLDPRLYFRHGQHTVDICNQQRTLADYLIDIWHGITFSFLVVYAKL